MYKKSVVGIGLTILFGQIAFAGQIHCFETKPTTGIQILDNKFELLIDDVPHSYFQNSPSSKVQVKDAYMRIDKSLSLTSQSIEGAAIGSVGMDGGKLLFVLQAVELGKPINIVVMRAEPWKSSTVTTGHIEQGTPGAQLLPVTCTASK